MGYVSFREFIPQMVKNGDESHQIRIRKKSPTKQKTSFHTHAFLESFGDGPHSHLVKWIGFIQKE